MKNTSGIKKSAKRSEDTPERIAKRIARSGLCSRREAEAMIFEGRVRLNGQLLESPAITVGRKDLIEVDGRRIEDNERTRLWLFHKPSGTVTTNRDPQGRKTMFELLPKSLPRVMTVGRLDINTEGLLLLTNDGGLARVLELPSTGWLRRYRVRAHGQISQPRLDVLRDGVAVDGVLYGSIEAELEQCKGTNVWLTVALREGKNREIKNVLGHLGLKVSRLIRISFGPFQLGELAPGEVREIRGRTLREQLGERLIEQSGADFEAAIRQKSSSGTPDDDQSTRKPESSGRRPRQKHKPGTLSDHVSEKLATTRSRAPSKRGRPRRKQR